MMVHKSLLNRAAVLILACFLVAACGGQPAATPAAPSQPEVPSTRPVNPPQPIATATLLPARPQPEASPALPADNPTPATGQPAVGQPFELHFGQSVDVAGSDLKVTFFSVADDNRCPVGMECAQAGEATFIITVSEDNDHPVSVILSTMPMHAAAVVGNHKVQLKDAQPPRQAKDGRPANQEYVLTLLVTDISDSSSAQVGQPFQLKGGQSAEIPAQALTVHFAKVLEDSRCPQSVSCFWSGQVRLELDVSKGASAPVALELSTLAGKNSADAYDYHFELQAVAPYPKTPEQKITFEEYTITLLVSPR